MGFFIFSTKSGMNKAAEAGIVSHFTEMSNATIEHIRKYYKNEKRNWDYFQFDNDIFKFKNRDNIEL